MNNNNEWQNIQALQTRAMAAMRKLGWDIHEATPTRVVGVKQGHDNLYAVIQNNQVTFKGGAVKTMTPPKEEDTSYAGDAAYGWEGPNSVD